MSAGQSEGQSEAAGGSEAGGDTGSQSANPLLGSRHSDSDSGDMSVLDSPRAGLFIMVPSVDSNNWTKAGGHHVEESTGGESRENQDRRASQVDVPLTPSQYCQQPPTQPRDLLVSDMPLVSARSTDFC